MKIKTSIIILFVLAFLLLVQARDKIDYQDPSEDFTLEAVVANIAATYKYNMQPDKYTERSRLFMFRCPSYVLAEKAVQKYFNGWHFPHSCSNKSD